MEIPFTGWDRGFNVMVLRMAELVAPTFTRGPDAPTSLIELNAYVEKHKNIHVSDQNQQQNVFGCDEANLAFRAWHDWTHWKYQTPLTPEGEKATYEKQLVDMMKVYGVDSISLRWAQMLYAEVVGQIEYKEKWGVFPVNQIGFDLAYLQNPGAALEMGLFHPLKIEAANDAAP